MARAAWNGFTDSQHRAHPPWTCILAVGRSRGLDTMNRAEANFGRVYEEHVWRVYGFLAYQVRDRPLAEDLTQATFERALRAWSRFDPRRGSEATWLLAIARNAMIDHHRRRREHELLNGEGFTGLVDGPEASSDLSVELAGALAELSDRDREVLALRFGADLTGARIADLLGLTLANVQQILSRSLRKLRMLMTAEETVLNRADQSVPQRAATS